MMIVFSDLDGSLLDHDTYDWGPAQPALTLLKERSVPLVLVSSKTLAELNEFREQLELEHPVVAENGAVIDIPTGYFGTDVRPMTIAVTRAELQSAYEEVKLAHGFRCEAFYELGVSGIARETGLPERQAILANDRKASEPVLWRDDERSAARFQQEMLSRGLRCVRGGRFLHLMGNTGKAEAVTLLLNAYCSARPGTTVTSVSLGDAPNDLGMLSVTDIAVVIPGEHRHAMNVDTKARVLRPASAGPAGWNAAMMSLLEERFDLCPAAKNDGE